MYFESVQIEREKRTAIRSTIIDVFEKSRSHQLSWWKVLSFTFPVTFAILFIMFFLAPSNMSHVADSKIPVISTYAQKQEISSINHDLDTIEKDLTNDSELNSLDDSNSL